MADREEVDIASYVARCDPHQAVEKVSDEEGYRMVVPDLEGVHLEESDLHLEESLDDDGVASLGEDDPGVGTDALAAEEGLPNEAEEERRPSHEENILENVGVAEVHVEMDDVVVVVPGVLA